MPRGPVDEHERSLRELQGCFKCLSVVQIPAQELSDRSLGFDQVTQLVQETPGSSSQSESRLESRESLELIGARVERSIGQEGSQTELPCLHELVSSPEVPEDLQETFHIADEACHVSRYVKPNGWGETDGGLDNPGKTLLESRGIL